MPENTSEFDPLKDLPRKKDYDPVAFYLERIQSMLIGIGEHYISFQSLRATNPDDAESRLNNLRDARKQAVLYTQRLTELLPQGVSIDHNRPLPRGLCSDRWGRLVEILERQKRGQAEICGWNLGRPTMPESAWNSGPLKGFPRKKDYDPVAFYLDRIQSMLIWIGEHYATFQRDRATDPANAKSELNNLRDTGEQAVLYTQRLTELLLQGVSIDRNRPVPPGLCRERWARIVAILEREHQGEAELGGWTRDLGEEKGTS